MCLAKMSTCNLSDLSSSFCKSTSSHDSHTEVHQPSSIRKSMTSHHTSSGHHLYEGDLVSKSSQSPATGAWAWASLGGGAPKKRNWLSKSTSFYFFRAPPREAQAQAPVAGGGRQKNTFFSRAPQSRRFFMSLGMSSGHTAKSDPQCIYGWIVPWASILWKISSQMGGHGA